MSGRSHSTGLLDTGLTATNLVSLGEFLDIMAVSCDSFNEETNRLIGRHQHGKDHLRCLENVEPLRTSAWEVNPYVAKTNGYQS